MVDHHVISARALPGDAMLWQDLAVGDRIPDWGGDPHFEVLEVEPTRHLVFWSQRARPSRSGVRRPPMRMTWALVLTEQEHEPGHLAGSSWLHLRLRLDLGRPAGPFARYGGGAIDAATVWLLGRGLNERLE